MTYVVGLTGGIACGKSNLTTALRSDGAKVIDADEISRALTAPGAAALPALRAAFGGGVFIGETLDRRALAKLVFSDESAMKTLNGILHPMVFDEMHKQLAALKAENTPVVFLDVPLLFETGINSWCDEVWCAYLPKDGQVRRLIERDGLTRAEAEKKVAGQMSGFQKKKLSDRVIDTRSSRENSAAVVLSMYHTLLETLNAQKEKPL